MTRSVRRLLQAVALSMLVSLAAAAPASALFHIAVIDEVMASYGGDAAVQFVEVKMLGPAQNSVAHSVFAAFDASGTYIGDILEVPLNVANSGNNVRWIVGTAQFQTVSGLTPDFVMPPNLLPTAGGMVCFGGGTGLVPQNPPTWDRNDFLNYGDCVAYGTYNGPSNVHTGSPTPLDADGHSLARVSDTDDNASDFACGDPATPTNNTGGSASLAATTACAAASTDRPVDGIKLIVKRAPSGKEKLVFVSKDPDFLFPPIGGGDDPSAGGASVDLLSPTEGTVSFALPPGVGRPGWTVRDAATDFYKFVNKDAPGGPSPVKVTILKQGKVLKVVGKQVGLPLAGPHDAMGIRVTTGSLRNCAFFGAGTIKRDQAGKFIGKGAAAAGLADCSDASLGGSPSGAFLD